MIEKDLLKFAVIGSVDDGKSTLIGRLLYDSNSVYLDQRKSIEIQSKNRGEVEPNLALLTDGLRAEREQGITIDVAYRYFSTSKRKFIISDCPGHLEYTRNAVTGVSDCDLVILLVDARKGIQEQTKRHALIASILEIKHLIVCVNKMDLIEYDKKTYDFTREYFETFLARTSMSDVRFIPISALKGDNIVNTSEEMDWYEGPSLLYSLEQIYIGSKGNHVDCRFPVQKVIRKDTPEYPDFRAFAGRVEGGVFRIGDSIRLLPSGFETTIKALHGPEGPIEEAFSPMSILMEIDGDYDLSRGDMIAKPNNSPTSSQDIDLLVCWLSKADLNRGKKYVAKQTVKSVDTIIKEVLYKIDIATLQRDDQNSEIGMNDIGRIRIRTSSTLFFDSFKRNRATGSMILIDPISNETVGAGLIL